MRKQHRKANKRRLNRRNTKALSQVRKDVIPPGHKLITVLEFGKLMYQHYGRGVISYPGLGYAPKYVSEGFSLLDPVDRVVLGLYDPLTEVLITYPLEDVTGVWVTEKARSNDAQANLKILISESFLAGDEQVMREALL